eukprot:CAMPEP_0185790416 /NCGR_PEP_ID=MMETSP1174-20130828/156222_1 /TAXON_ID=35687 /ORGANISM="Dictyocha speculum, Strain CCMP1381" /LENGTH=34 /DNA_ID= /DNA_START= /DNA_END= /DNA_ORIENTATION=
MGHIHLGSRRQLMSPMDPMNGEMLHLEEAGNRPE